MRKTLFFSIIILLFSSACRKTIEYETLSQHIPLIGKVYALKDTDPDSAMVLIQAIDDTIDLEALEYQSGFLNAEYQVLRTEVLYKNYGLTSKDTMALAAFRFYDSVMPGKGCSRYNQDLAYQKARAYYYKAVVEEVLTQRHVEAFTDYLNALWMMDGLRHTRRVFASNAAIDIDYEHFTGLIFDRLAWFFYTYDAWDMALECLNKSNDCYMKEDDALGVASNYELMGDVMLAQGDRMHSMAFYKKSDSIHEKLQTDNIYQHFSSLIHRALDLYNVGDKNASYELLLHALDVSDNSWLQRQVRFSLGYFYYENHEYDSALYNYEHSYPLLPRQTIKSYCRIIKSANIIGDSVKAAHYGELLSDLYLGQVAKSGQKTKMISLYEGFKTDEKDVRQKDFNTFVILFITLLIITILVVIFFFERRRRRHKREIENRERIEASLVEEIETTKSDSRNKEEKIRALQSKLDKAIFNPDFQKLPFDEKLEALYDVPVCKRILTVREANVKAFYSYPELVLSENQLTMLVNAVDAVFPKFSVKMIEDYPRLKHSDVVYCCLYILGITEVQAAALTGKTYQAVWTRSLKLHDIFDNKSSLQFILHGILKDWQS